MTTVQQQSMDSVESFFNNTTTQFYVVLTGTSSLLSGIMMFIEWLHFTYYGMSIIDRVTALLFYLLPFSLSAKKEDPAERQKRLAEAKPVRTSHTLFRGAETYRYQAETGKVVLTQLDMHLSLGNLLYIFTYEGARIEEDAANQQIEAIWKEGDRHKQLQTAHQVLESNPNCCFALILLAEEEAQSIVQVEELLRQSLKYADASYKHSAELCLQDPLYKPLHERNANVCTYCRLRLAICAQKLGKFKESMKLYRELLKDNHTSALATVEENICDCLLEMQNYSELTQFLSRQEESVLVRSTVLCYTIALLKSKAVGEKFCAESLSRRGPTPAEVAAFEAIHRAVELNPHIPKYLLELKALTVPSEHFVRRGDSEAIFYSFHHLHHWKRVEGALPLLATTWEGTFQRIPFPLERGHLFQPYPLYVEVMDRELLPPHHELSVFPQQETPFFMVFTGVLCFSFMSLTVVAYHFPSAMTQYAKTVTSLFLSVLNKLLPHSILGF